MALVKLCDQCKVDESVRAVNDFYFEEVRNGYKTGKTEVFNSCNPCHDALMVKILGSIGNKTKFIPKRKYSRQRTPMIEVGR